MDLELADLFCVALFCVALYRLLWLVEYRVSISVQRHSLTFLSAIKATTGSP
jgi:hypothetical protein